MDQVRLKCHPESVVHILKTKRLCFSMIWLQAFNWQWSLWCPEIFWSQMKMESPVSAGGERVGMKRKFEL